MKYWINNVDYLFRNFDIVPSKNVHISENFNRLSRLIIIICLLISLLNNSTKPLYYCIFIICILSLIYFISINQMITEKFENYTYNGSIAPDNIHQNYNFNFGDTSSFYKSYPTSNFYNLPSPYIDSSFNYSNGSNNLRIIEDVNINDSSLFMKEPILRQPTPNNPFMNVMPVDYGQKPIFDNYPRYEKMNYPVQKSINMKNDVDSNFIKGLYQDADSKLWNRLNSQRQFVSQPVGSVPNNQNQFANWLYGANAAADGKLCKSGSIWAHTGVKYTDDSMVCNGFNVATPTNQGFLNGGLMSSVEGGSK